MLPPHSQKERYKTVPFKVQVAVTGVVPWRVQFCTSSQRYNIVPSSFVPFKGQFCTSRNICTHCNEGIKCTLLKASSGYCPKHPFGGLRDTHRYRQTRETHTLRARETSTTRERKTHWETDSHWERHTHYVRVNTHTV